MPTTTTRPTVTRAPLPARCEATWLTLPARPGLEGTADINGDVYTVASIIDRGRRVGVRFVSPRGDVRDVDLTVEPRECSCEDFIVRRQGKDRDGCKHCKSVKILDAEARDIRAERSKWAEAT
jgi:hypothetical protein